MRMRILTALITAAVAAGTALAAVAEDKATEVLAAARKTIGDKKLDALRTLSVEASVQRNVNTMQLTSDVEVLLDLPDRYIRTDTSTGPMGGGFSVGFNGEKPIRPANSIGVAGGGMMIRIGPGPGPGAGGAAPAEKLSPEEQERVDKQMLRSQRADLSRLMLGWFAAAHPAINARYTYAGEAESPDGKAHVVDVANADGFSARVFIDQQTHLPLMVTYQGPQPRMITAGGPAGGARPGGTQVRERPEMSEEERRKAGEAAERHIQELQKQPPAMVDFTLFFDDWRDVGGVKFPHRIRRASAGVTNEEWTVTRVKVNPKIDAKKFEG